MKTRIVVELKNYEKKYFEDGELWTDKVIGTLSTRDCRDIDCCECPFGGFYKSFYGCAERKGFAADDILKIYRENLEEKMEQKLEVGDIVKDILTDEEHELIDNPNQVEDYPFCIIEGVEITKMGRESVYHKHPRFILVKKAEKKSPIVKLYESFVLDTKNIEFLDDELRSWSFDSKYFSGSYVKQLVNKIPNGRTLLLDTDKNEIVGVE